MPTYSLRQHDNGTFYIHWTEGRRSKRQSTGQTEEVAAQIFLGEWLKGEAADQAGATPIYTVQDLWDDYFKRHAEKNCADTRSFNTCWNNLQPHFGALTLPELTRKGADNVDKIEEYILLREDGEIGRCPATSGTIRGELTRMLACFNWHADPKRKTISKADVPVWEMPPKSPPRDRWLRVDEIRKLMAAAADRSAQSSRMSRVERFLWLALETAARRQAILELTWGRVDFELNLIDYRVPSRAVTKKRRAVVPISTTLRPILLRAYEERQGDLVCDNQSCIWRAVKSVAKQAEVERVSPHVLRHTAATHMLRNGVPIATVAGILADTIETVERTYWHHIPSAGAGAVELLAGKLLALTPTAEPTKCPERNA
ncbi:site-specific integrase [Bradyrhizobium sp. PMVTL-01]|uniref:site-specific integrase n=1 Tax=Bradyrhizobium sp. PMVTL-01 TaxID=3434999 RepID=UPI003F6E6A17